MKIGEKFIYASISFVALYVLISVGLRVFELTSDYNSHLFGGIIATISGVLLFLFFILKK